MGVGKRYLRLKKAVVTRTSSAVKALSPKYHRKTLRGGARRTMGRTMGTMEMQWIQEVAQMQLRSYTH